MANEIRFGVLRGRLEAAGWVLDRVNGSHHIFKKPGSRNVIIPVHNGKVGPAYVRHVEKIIREDAKHN